MGLSKRTAQRQAANGTLPVPFKIDMNGHYMVFVDSSDFPTTLSAEEYAREALDFGRQLTVMRRQYNRMESKLDRILNALE